MSEARLKVALTAEDVEQNPDAVPFVVFTREDIDLLSEAAGYIEGEDGERTAQADALMHLAARIEALLPPEGV